MKTWTDKYIEKLIRDSAFQIRPLILTVILAALYFGSGKIKKDGISPILLICLSALAGIVTYGF